MAQGTALRRLHEVVEDVALCQQTGFKVELGSGLDGIYAFQRRRVVFRGVAHHVSGVLEIRIALRVLARQMAHQGGGPNRTDFSCKGQGYIQQGLAAWRHAVYQVLTGHLRQDFTLNRLATDDHVECGFHAQGSGQTLRAARARNEPQLDFGQGNAATRRGHAVMAAQRQLQPAAHHHRVQGRHYRFFRVFDRADHGQQVGLLASFWGAKFANIGAA